MNICHVTSQRLFAEGVDQQSPQTCQCKTLTTSYMWLTVVRLKLIKIKWY